MLRCPEEDSGRMALGENKKTARFGDRLGNVMIINEIPLEFNFRSHYIEAKCGSFLSLDLLT